MTTKALIIAATAAAAIVGLAAPDAAEAKRSRGKDVIEKHYITDGPVKGFSGFAGGYYCDYRRVPNRKCTLLPNGQEKCVIVNWTLTHACY
ncbi:MAG TPA: hypothetical protein VF226_04455 [Hyphomicrobiaceae bacterium]